MTASILVSPVSRLIGKNDTKEFCKMDDLSWNCLVKPFYS